MKSIKTLIMVFVMGMFVMSCAVGNVPNDTPAGVATETQISFTVTSTAIPQFTSTPRPTYTATPIPDWIVNFTEPILKAISDRSPTYEDDFSNPYSGWYNGQTTGHPDVKIFGEKKYDNGEYLVVANGATANEPVVCSGVEDRNVGSYADFVAEFDVKFVSNPGENHQDWQLAYHRNRSGLYSISLTEEGWINISKCAAGLDGCPALVSYKGRPINSGDSWNHIVLIVQGTKMAAYVNGVPTLYVNDAPTPSEFRKGYFSINACNFASTTLETRWDNFRVWDISNLP